ncbi:hypothetical protein M1555_05185 [Patescibacteria group bacterium]|nr:hypothetical protein [Patescibacteria group bacterium]
MKTFPNHRQHPTSHDCGPVSLQNIYEYFGKPMSTRRILSELGITNQDRTYPAQLARHLRRHGLETTMLTSSTYCIAPEWRDLPKGALIDRLRAWLTSMPDADTVWVTNAMHLLFYLEDGGTVAIGDPSGHFVVLYDAAASEYSVSDPFPTGLPDRDGLYAIPKPTLLTACLLWGGQVVSVKKP